MSAPLRPSCDRPSFRRNSTEKMSMRARRSSSDSSWRRFIFTSASPSLAMREREISDEFVDAKRGIRRDQQGAKREEEARGGDDCDDFRFDASAHWRQAAGL